MWAFRRVDEKVERWVDVRAALMVDARVSPRAVQWDSVKVG